MNTQTKSLMSIMFIISIMLSIAGTRKAPGNSSLTVKVIGNETNLDLTQIIGPTTRVSVSSDGSQGNNSSWISAISADSRYVAFESEASNLVPEDTNNAIDIFVHDRQTGLTVRISVASDGTQGNGSSWSPAISANGRYITYYSEATNLVSGDSNGYTDVFVHDQQTGQNTRVSVASNGSQGNRGSSYPTISADGHYVAFHSNAYNLIPGDTYPTHGIFVHDRQNGETSLVSVGFDGMEASADISAISADSRYIAFSSSASNLVPGDTNNAFDIFVHDRQTSQTTRVSIASNGIQSDDDSNLPAISADGRYVAFYSWASNLVSGDTNGRPDIFVHDRQVGQTTRVSVTSDGTQVSGDSDYPAISADGRYVAFQSLDSNLVSNDTNNAHDVFVHDQQTSQTSLVSVASDGTQGDTSSFYPSISADGRYVAFYSVASNLVGNDTNGYVDVFVHDRGTGSVTFSISGQVKDNNNNALSNATVQMHNGTTTLTDDYGNYSFTYLITGTYTLTVNLPGYISFETWTVDVPPDRTGVDFMMWPLPPPPPTPKVVVLVHGWHGLPGTPADTCNPNTLAEHATNIYNIPANDFGVFARTLILDGWDVWIAHITTSPEGTPPIEENAVCLKNQLANIRSETKVSRVVLIAHSMGGLVSRAYMENPVVGFYAGDVAQLITLGTPHVGTTAGLVPCLFNEKDYAACQFSPLGIDFFNQTFSQRARNAIYNFIGGNLTPLIIGKQLARTDGPNDGVVGVNSGTGYLYRPFLQPLPIITGSNVTRFALPASHTVNPLWYPSFFNDTPGNDTTLTEAYQCVRELLDISGGNCPSQQTVEVMSTSLITSTFAQLPTFSDNLVNGEVATYTLPIDTNGQSLFTLSWTIGTLSLTLTDPVGTVIDPAYAASHPEEVIYYENSDPSSQLLASYAFTSTLSGDYTLTVVAEDVEAIKTDYSIATLVESTRTLNFETNKTLYSIGDTAVITSSVLNSDIGLTGVTVTANIYRPGAITDTVILTEQGGGVYAGVYTIPIIPGYLGISIIANGNDNGTAFARQVDSLLAISPKTIQLNNQYSDSPQDTDNNGLHESLNLGIGLTSIQAGNYIISGDLVGAGNVFVAHGVMSVTLGTGVLTTTLPFNGDDIRYSEIDGPYTLTNLTIVDQQYAGIPTVWIIPNVWITSAYHWWEFGVNLPKIYLPLIVR